MINSSLTVECNKIFNFWKLEEYFTPSDYPALALTIKEGKQNIPFDAYNNEYSIRSLPLKRYKAHNEYLRQKNKSDERLYNRANIYCGCYRTKDFVEKMAEKCKLDMEKYAEINELTGRFYAFSVQIDLDGKITEEGVQVSPFFYAVLCMIKAEDINVNIMQGNIWKLNEDVNEILKQNNVRILEFTDVTIVKNIIFDKLKIESESEVGLKNASDKVYACKGLKKEDETSDFKVIENSVQTFADNINEFNGMIGERQVGCPLVVHRRCIEPMFSISNLISYDNRMFNKTNKREEYLKPENPFLIKKSGWINVEGAENGGKDHFVKKQAERVCQLMEDAVHIYSDLFETDDKIFIITPFRTVAESMRKFVISYFSVKGYDKEILSKWTKNCVGTVHTFQGKDANEVLLVLGCSNKSVGAMNWVVKKANILNVACTRAKYRIAIIGNIKDWKNRRYFRAFIPNLIDIINVKKIDDM